MPAEFFKHPFMSDRALSACDASAMVEAMLAFELALAEVQEASGAVPDGASWRMREQLESAPFDMTTIAQGIATGGNLAIPFVKESRAVLPESLKRYWHQGATSQDVVDSALMLVIKPRLEALDALLLRCRAAAITLMEEHAHTPMVGRTLMQQALPITFGVKVAHWALGLEQARRRLSGLELPVQFGGAVGVHSGWGAQGLDWMDALAKRLGLATPVLPWHTDRQPIQALSAALSQTAGALDKLALDISLLTQTEVSEVAEPAAPGMGESSSMPHKRNPVRCALIRGAARQVYGHASVLTSATAQPLERGLGEWHAEWAPLVESVLFVEGALEQAVTLLEGLEVHSEAMRRNLAATGGGIMAEPVARLLAPVLGQGSAKRVAAEAAETARRTGSTYAEVLADYPEVARGVSADELRKACDPALYLGSSAAQLARAKQWLLKY
ncbi:MULTISPECIES: adenylosuccinate lyase family protein [unclassified Halomonas]|uniref:class-II fumarase/aspartase family protein n=1 Tax=unclassified Halomonas TaxID=2609666 RepID=UPI00209F3B58|nr:MULTISPECIES: adenylosuccinate lyase family protein [unclassified Halomonas]MCP1314224.1 adenylosuccinate lyase family protein [Halomonas sp. 707D7]MCP1325503.1 adenylosuccinate lyase family protein [Halomonas sp. 707D4]